MWWIIILIVLVVIGLTLRGRHLKPVQNKDAYLKQWADTVFENGAGNRVYTEDMLQQLTDQLAGNDLRIIQESADIVARTRSEETKQKRQKLMKERYAHLMTLEPYLNETHKEQFSEAKKAVKGLF